MKDFFISYNSADRSWAEWIAWQLEEAGYTTVLQAWDFRPGSNVVLGMQRAATEAERILAVLTPNYLASRFTQPEWAAAFERDPTGERGLLVPVRVRECDLQGLLSRTIYIDLIGLDEDVAKDELLDGVRRGRAKPTDKPGFPGNAQHEVIPRPNFPGTSASDGPDIESQATSGRKAALTSLEQWKKEYGYERGKHIQLTLRLKSDSPNARDMFINIKEVCETARRIHGLLLKGP